MDVTTFEGFDYEPNDIDDEIFLSEAPLSLMKENIRSQFENPGENHKNDFIQTFLNKYAYSKKIELEEESENLEDLHDEFISYMEDLFKEFLGIGLPDIEEKNDEIQEEIVHYLYRYFIINIKKNFVRFCLNYIQTNKEELSTMIEPKKDIAYLSYKDYINDEFDLTIISNISAVIETIFSQDVDIFTFLEHTRSDGGSNLEIDFITHQYNKGTINGNFVEYYVEMLDNDLLVDIQCKVKNKLLKKYIDE